ncbi:MAG: hypothetical protein CMA65_05480 [Euryarchaeota archaeon]|nr:hypothetical protein [Euryarchaeota archaeon]
MHKSLRATPEQASGAMLLCRAPGSCYGHENHHDEDTVHPYLLQRSPSATNMGWKEQTLELFEIFGPASLAVVSFTEAIIQPVPPDLLYMPMLVNAIGDTPLVVWLWLVVTVSSVLGSLVGYYIGKKWGTSLMVRFGQERHLLKLEQLTLRYGSWGIFIAAFSPIPYKVLGWMAGMGHMKHKPFILAGFFGRGLRFGLEAILIGLYGSQALNLLNWLLDNEIMLAIALILGFAVLVYAWQWWNNLDSNGTASTE